MATWPCTQEEAWQILIRVSQHSNTKLHDVAEAVVATTQQVPSRPICKRTWRRRWRHGALAEDHGA
ncbi:ANTAR domain-containing protein [Streptomyces sp. NPDC001137]|uniref:ANTAR domain-containing protein n=1 Tax=Streptomyces sp. NPDC001137 TaxID=3154378 RepID=UPI00333004F2